MKTTNTSNDTHDYLVSKGWKVMPNQRRAMYRDPKTKRLFAKQFAEIVQQGYDDEALAVSRAKATAKEYKSIMKLQKWLETEHTVDEVYPPGSVWEERNLPKNRQVFRASNEEFKFGKHKGESLTRVIINNPNYVLWLHDKGVITIPKVSLKAANNSKE